MVSANEAAPAPTVTPQEIKLGHRTFVLRYGDLLPALPDDVYQDLKRDIEQHGIRVPLNVEYLGGGERYGYDRFLVLDGQHRLKIAQELGLSWNEVPVRRDDYASDEEREDVAWALNAHRRHLTREQRQAHALRLRQRGLSYRDIAERLGVGAETVRRDLSTVSNETVQLPDTITGRDGKERPAVMPRPVPTPEVPSAPVPGESPAAKISGQDAIDAHLAELRQDVWKDAPRTFYQGGPAWCMKCHQVHDEWELVCVSGLNVWHCKRCEFNTPDSQMTATSPTAPAPVPAPSPATPTPESAMPKNVHFSSETAEWFTPPDVLALVSQVLGAIALDPCSNSHETPNVPAARHYTKEDDGLVQAWEGTVYMNPPYGDEIGKWVEKLAGEYEAGRVTAAIALLPARTDTAWFRRLREYPRCFIAGRVKFLKPDGSPVNSAPFPSMAVYCGPEPARFVEVFRALGDVFALWR